MPEEASQSMHEPTLALTYAPSDESRVKQLLGELTAHVTGLLLEAPDTSDSGDNSPAGIDAARYYGFVVTEASVSSPACRRELSYALRIGKPAFSILLTSSVDEKTFPAGLNGHRSFDFRNPRRHDAELQRLLAYLSSSPDGTSTSHAAIELQFAGSRNGMPSRVSVTEDLARLCGLAAEINDYHKNDVDLSFSSILLAITIASDPFSESFQIYAISRETQFAKLMSQQSTNQSQLDELKARSPSEAVLKRRLRITVSASRLFGAAWTLRERMSGHDALFDARHLIGAYIYDLPRDHESAIADLNVVRAEWSNWFLGVISANFQAEFQAWSTLHYDRFGTAPNVPIWDGNHGPAGPSSHVHTDVWTVNDSLGYRAYAHAIAQFMLNKKSKPPLTVSIQAPWGGGKTSLMRLIQLELDPAGVPSAPQHRDRAKEAAQSPLGTLRIGDVLALIRRWTSGSDHDAQLPSLSDAASSQERRLTVWFNAWKYEGTEQVWAGLADAIISQVADRLSIREREEFWLKLHLKRLDAEKLRRSIYDRIFAAWWRSMRTLLVVFALPLLAAVAATAANWHQVLNISNPLGVLGMYGVGFAAFLGLVSPAVAYVVARLRVKREPAKVSLEAYLKIPDYAHKVGFVHDVAADLQRVFAAIPARFWPVVIFIDDLDRCSPGNIAKVVEAVNLFLAGDFPDCMFVLGMDPELVAAALEVAHKDLIAALPRESSIPIGWRFMDKFVQLPFVIPPAADLGVERYTLALLAEPTTAKENEDISRYVEESATSVADDVDVDAVANKVREERGLDERQFSILKDRIEATLVQRNLDKGIKAFSDTNPEIRETIKKATVYFRTNPRELKRFVNEFRFQYCLWWAARAQGADNVTIDQLLLWTILLMKWPGMMRWLRRGSDPKFPTTANGTSTAQVAFPMKDRFAQLEQITREITDANSWRRVVAESLDVETASNAWLDDDAVREFLCEAVRRKPGERLSDGIGCGLW